MKQSVLVITTVMILLGGVIVITLIQSTEATAINTTRSNIKSAAKKEVKGNDNQLSEQDANVN